jgi:hypothetical protein
LSWVTYKFTGWPWWDIMLLWIFLKIVYVNLFTVICFWRCSALDNVWMYNLPILKWNVHILLYAWHRTVVHISCIVKKLFIGAFFPCHIEIITGVLWRQTIYQTWWIYFLVLQSFKLIFLKHDVFSYPYFRVANQKKKRKKIHIWFALAYIPPSVSFHFLGNYNFVSYIKFGFIKHLTT